VWVARLTPAGNDQPRATDVTAKILGDPPPGRAAHAQKNGQAFHRPTPGMPRVRWLEERPLELEGNSKMIARGARLLRSEIAPAVLFAAALIFALPSCCGNRAGLYRSATAR
jgi:hypothetical protein